MRARSLLRRAVLVVVALVAALLAGVAAQGQESALDVHIREATLDDDGATEVVVAVGGSGLSEELAAEAFSVTENGEPIEDFAVAPIDESEDAEARTVVMLFDTSGSTEGEALEGAKEAAIQFADSVTERGVGVGLVTFADTAALAVPPASDPQPVVDAIEGLAASGETAFFDAVLVAARSLQNIDGQRTIVAFTDGADTTSTADLAAAVAAAQTIEAPVSAVALNTGDLDVAALQELTSTSGGRLLETTDVDQLAGAFEQVAQSLTSQYVISYTGGVATGEFDLGVTVTTEAGAGSDTITLLSARDSTTPGQPQPVALPDAGVFGSPMMFYGALGAGFLALAVLFILILVPRGDRRVNRTLERGMRVYSRRGGERETSHTRSGSGDIGRRAVELVDSFPKPEGYDERVQVRLDRAAWPLRAAEFTTLRVLAVLVGVLIGWGLFGHWLIAIVLAVAGWVVPSVILDQRVRTRQNAFMSQLPDTLQLLAGSLKAGYGILQGIDTIVKETADPTSTEFQRVLTEARLGLPLEESLEAMADRIGSEDFRWVTVAVNIQRRVGGNLADLLETVSETLREREATRRQISVLSAEGRLSAVILTLLPVVLAVYMVVVNPSYIETLFTRTIGQLMVGGAVVLMGVGVFWMRRLIDIDV